MLLLLFLDAALPTDFRNALRLWSRWIDAVGNKSNLDANIEETIDACTLLAEFEAFGSRTYANQYEQNYQLQMEYYRLGNSRARKRYNEPSSTSKPWWWLASPNCNHANDFVGVSGDGGLGASYTGDSADYSNLIVPAFKT